MTAVGIKVEGLKEALAGLKDIDRRLPSELKRGIRQDAQPVLKDARSHASSLGGSGDYAASMAMRTIKDGVRIQSDDPGAGAIEFARRGAYYVSGPRRGLPLGVPSGNPPRALVRSAAENEEAVRRAVEARVESVIKRYLDG